MNQVNMKNYTILYVAKKIVHIRYRCPHCNEVTAYDTDSLPKFECHKCFKKIDFKVVEIK